MSTWGMRKCLVCQNEFEAQYPANIVCSPECFEKRKKELKKITNKKYQVRVKAMLAECVAGRATIAALQDEISLLARERDNFKCESEIGKQQNDSLLGRLDELEKENQRLLEIIKNKDAEIEKLNGYLKKRNVASTRKSIPVSEIEKYSAINDFKSKNTLQTCERLKLSAMKLPCGKKPQCWEKPICKNCKGKVKPDNLFKISNSPEQSLKEVEDEL